MEQKQDIHFQLHSRLEADSFFIKDLKLSRLLLPNLSSHKLDSIKAHFNLPGTTRHRGVSKVCKVSRYRPGRKRRWCVVCDHDRTSRQA